MTAMVQHLSDVSQYHLAAMLVTGLGREIPAPMSAATDIEQPVQRPAVDLSAGMLLWEAIVANGPDWNALDYEMEWLGI